MSKALSTYGLKRRQALLRQLTLWVGLLCLLSHASSAMHILLVDHVYCEEHGELVHADEGHSHEHFASAIPSSPNEESVRTSASQNGHGHAHGDCHACSERRNLSNLSLGAALLNASILDDGFSLLEDDIRFFGTAIHKSAPKTSPPA